MSSESEEALAYAIQVLSQRVVLKEEIAGYMAASEDPAGTREQEVVALRANAASCRSAIAHLQASEPPVEMSYVFDIDYPGEVAAGFYQPYYDKVTVTVESGGNPEFAAFILDMLKQWYDGAFVHLTLPSPEEEG